MYLKIAGGTYGALDGIQRVTYKLVNNVEAKEECGTRYVTLVEGTYGISGTVERFYTGSGTWAFFGATKGENALDYYSLQIYPNGSGSLKPFIQIDGIKFNSTSPSHRPSANLMLESWDFLATGSPTTGTVA